MIESAFIEYLEEAGLPGPPEEEELEGPFWAYARVFAQVMAEELWLDPGESLAKSLTPEEMFLATYESALVEGAKFYKAVLEGYQAWLGDNLLKSMEG